MEETLELMKSIVCDFKTEVATIKDALSGIKKIIDEREHYKNEYLNLLSQMNEKLLPQVEVSKMLSLSSSQINKMRRQGKIVGVICGRRYMYRMSEVMRVMEGRKSYS